MKAIMIASLTFSLISSSVAFAQAPQSTGTSMSKAPVAEAPSRYMLDGFNLGLEYMSLNSSEMDIKSKVTGTVERGLKTDVSQASKQMGVKAGFKQITRAGLGFDLNLSLLKLENRPEGTSDVTTVLPSVSLTLGASQFVYGALGFNTNFVVGDNDSKYSPRIGYQVGGGVVLGKNFNVEVFYNWINLGVESQYALMEVRTASTNARLIFAF